MHDIFVERLTKMIIYECHAVYIQVYQMFIFILVCKGIMLYFRNTIYV